MFSEEGSQVRSLGSENFLSLMNRLIVPLLFAALLSGCANIPLINYDAWNGRPMGPLAFTSRDFWSPRQPAKVNERLLKRYKRKTASELIAMEEAIQKGNRSKAEKSMTIRAALTHPDNRARFRDDLTAIMFDMKNSSFRRYYAFRCYYPVRGDTEGYLALLNRAADDAGLAYHALNRIQDADCGFGNERLHPEDTGWLDNMSEKQKADFLLKSLNSTNTCRRRAAAGNFPINENAISYETLPLDERIRLLTKVAESDVDSGVRFEAKRRLPFLQDEKKRLR